jgi:hypothetical protein
MDKTSIKSVALYDTQIEYVEHNFLNLSELTRYLIDNYEPYKKWVEANARRR